MENQGYSEAANQAAKQFMKESGMDSRDHSVEEELDGASANKKVMEFVAAKDIEGAANYLAKYGKAEVTKFMTDLSADLPEDSKDFLLAVNNRINEKKATIQ